MYERNYQTKVLKEKESPKKQLSLFGWRRVLALTITIALLIGAVALIRTPRLQVVTVNVVGTSVADPEDVSQFVKDQLAGNYLHFLPKASIFLLPTAGLSRKIQTAFPRFKTVVVTHRGLHALVVTVAEYQGRYLWCPEDQAGEQGCYFMDSNGIVFAPAPYFSGDAYQKIFIGTKGNLPFAPLSDSQLALVPLVYSRLSAIMIKPLEFHFHSDHELDVLFTHNSAIAKIIFDPTLPIDTALVALFTGVRSEPLMSQYRDQMKVLQYIDLRFSNKVVYKFQ